MKNLVFLVGLIFCCSAHAQVNLNGQSFNLANGLSSTEVPSSLLGQIADIKGQLIPSLKDLPAGFSRIAIYRLRADRQEFSPGMKRYIEGMVEDVFHDQAKCDVISSPELKTTRVTSTDTSFQMSNAVSDAEELWKLGRKLRVDGFLDGSISRTKEGDILLTLKLIKQETAEVIWTKSFVAGPSAAAAKPKQFEVVANLDWSYWGVDRYLYNSIDRNSGLTYYRYSTELGVQQVMNESHTMFLQVNAGVGYLEPVADDPSDSTFNKASWIPYLSVGTEITYALINKPNVDNGYYLGIYGGFKAIIPNSIMQGLIGFSSRPSNNFGLSAGISFYPLHHELKTGLIGSTPDISYMQAVSYDLRIQTYLF